jgi:glycosyltransferase involved in cell wall biosynthesis
MSTAAIYFHPDGYVTAREDLKGRHVAGESFLIGFLRHSGQKELVCCAEDRDCGAGFFALAACHAPGRPVRLIGHDALAELAGPGCLFVPGANIEQFAWERRRVGQRAYSLCGVTHTTAEYPPLYGALLTAPVQPWDALICTSEAARSTIEAILLPYADYLRHRLGATRLPMPRLPVIPLGIDTASFRTDRTAREAERSRLGIGSDDVAVLYLGRLSSHAKAHPIPMYLALQKAAERTRRRIVLIQAGWFGHEAIAQAFTEGARRHCPDVSVLFVDGRAAETRSRIWAAADIFTSLVDNVQETFGLTPVEAMAAGLPGVVSDWNGYRETVRDGVDGFRVPTWLPPAGAGQDLAEAYGRGRDNYDYFIGRVGQFAAVEIEAAAEAYLRLVDDAELRRRMGTAAQAQAARFDWAEIIPRYRALWAQLAELRAREPEIAPWPGGSPVAPQSSPLWPDPMVKFRTYPTRILSGETRLARSDAASAAALAELAAEPLNSLAEGMLSPRADLELALEMLAPPGAAVETLMAQLPAERRLLMARSLVHLLKFGLLSPVRE